MNMYQQMLTIVMLFFWGVVLSQQQVSSDSQCL